MNSPLAVHVWRRILASLSLCCFAQAALLAAGQALADPPQADVPAAPDAAPVLKKEWLKNVPNGHPFVEIFQGKADHLPEAERKELTVFSQALVYAGRTPAVALANSAKVNEQLRWPQLSEHPGKYQGQVVTLKGWLKRLVRREAPAAAAQNFVTHFYEGWVYTGFDDQNAVFVTFTELPREVEPAEKLNLYVEFHGYYFKQFRYLSAKGSQIGLFVVARTFRVLSQPNAGSADQAPPLTEEWLKYVRDDREFPNIKDKDEKEITPQERFEIMAYTEALVDVAKTPAKAFANSVKDNGWITFSHMFQEPGRYRGKVVPVRGRLKRLRKIESTVEAEKQGVPFAYEGWVFTETAKSPPVCVLFAHLPRGMSPGENVDYDVHFDGYFFKRYLYLAGDGKRLRTLVFFAPTVETRETPARAEWGSSMTGVVFGGIGVLAAGTLILIIALHWWFRRGDAPVRAQVASARTNLMAWSEPESQPSSAPELHHDGTNGEWFTSQIGEDIAPGEDGRSP